MATQLGSDSLLFDQFLFLWFFLSYFQSSSGWSKSNLRRDLRWGKFWKGTMLTCIKRRRGFCYFAKILAEIMPDTWYLVKLFFQNKLMIAWNKGNIGTLVKEVRPPYVVSLSNWIFLPHLPWENSGCPTVWTKSYVRKKFTEKRDAQFQKEASLGWYISQYVCCTSV